MSPTLSDDLLVRDLHERADLSLPRMSLDPADVLVASRRQRRRRTAALSAAGALAAGAFVVGAWQLTGPQRTEITPAYPDPAFESGTFSLRVAHDTREVETDAGLAVDLGVPVHDVTSADADRSMTWALLPTDYYDDDPDTVDGPALELRELAADGSTRTSVTWGLGAALPGTADLPLCVAAGSPHEWTALCAVPPGFEGGRVTLAMHLRGETIASAIPVPTFAVPGLDGDFVAFVAEDPETTDGFWPDPQVVFTAADGSTTDAWPMGGEPTEDTVSIQVAQDVREVETAEGTAVDLGIPVPAVWDPLGQGLTYSLRAGVFGDGDPGTPDITGLWLDSLPTKTAGGGGTVDEALTPANRNPIWMSMLGDHEAYMVGVRPPALEGATIDLIIERDTGKQVVPIPTFRVPGLDADVWFVALTDPEVDIRDWPPTSIRVTYPDGKTASWSLAGLAQANP